MFKRVGIVSRTAAPAVQEVLLNVMELLNARGSEVLVDLPSDMNLASAPYETTPDGDLLSNCDLVISLGGDGTLLQTAGLIYPHDVPLVGVNLGRLGFLTDFACSNIAS